MQATTVVDEEVLDNTLKDISRALLESDVNVKLVGTHHVTACMERRPFRL